MILFAALLLSNRNRIMDFSRVLVVFLCLTEWTFFCPSVVLPGGNIDLCDSGYVNTGKILYDLAVKV